MPGAVKLRHRSQFNEFPEVVEGKIDWKIDRRLPAMFIGKIQKMLFTSGKTSGKRYIPIYK